MVTAVPASALLFFLGLGAWLWNIGRDHLAALAFGVAGFGAVGIVLYRIAERGTMFIARRRAPRRSVVLETEPTAALQRTSEALRRALPQGELEVDDSRMMARVTTAGGWATPGDIVTATIREMHEGSVVTIVYEWGPEFSTREGTATIDRVADLLG